MNNAKLTNTQDKRPVRKAKAGRFEVSFWRWTKPASQQQENGFSVEQPVEINRACIRYSTWDWEKRVWNDRFIWCNVEELDYLVRAIDEIKTTVITDCEIHEMMYALSKVDLEDEP